VTAIRPLSERDLPQAQRIVRRAFGMFIEGQDLDTFWNDFDYVYGRFGAEHTVAFAVEDADGALAGINFATRWGSIGFFGPLAIRPDLWNRGHAQPLLEAVCAAFAQWRVSHAGLATFPHSTKHIWLYQKFGFFPRFLTPIMAAPAAGETDAAGRWARYSELPPEQRREAEQAVRELCEALFAGLDLAAEIRTCTLRQLGDTILLWEGDSRLAGFAVCHWGPASEAPTGDLFVKFGAVQPGGDAAGRFSALLDACGALARSVGVANVLAGVNLAREEAFRHMVARGFRARTNVVTMHKPNEPGYSRPGLYVLDDWR
jgi:GNAT superfamily N-acetyltransferase